MEPNAAPLITWRYFVAISNAQPVCRHIVDDAKSETQLAFAVLTTLFPNFDACRYPFASELERFGTAAQASLNTASIYGVREMQAIVGVLFRTHCSLGYGHAHDCLVEFGSCDDDARWLARLTLRLHSEFPSSLWLLIRRDATTVASDAIMSDFNASVKSKGFMLYFACEKLLGRITEAVFCTCPLG